MADLDDLLDDIEIEGAGNEPTSNKVIEWTEEIKTPAYEAWINAVSAVPEDVRDRWSSHLVPDMNADMKQTLQPSEMYRSWDGQPPSHQSSGKLLQEAVRNACQKCGFDEKKTTTLLSLTNALESGKICFIYMAP